MAICISSQCRYACRHFILDVERGVDEDRRRRRRAARVVAPRYRQARGENCRQGILRAACAHLHLKLHLHLKFSTGVITIILLITHAHASVSDLGPTLFFHAMKHAVKKCCEVSPLQKWMILSSCRKFTIYFYMCCCGEQAYVRRKKTTSIGVHRSPQTWVLV